MPQWLVGLVCASAVATASGCARSAAALAIEAEDRARLEEVKRESEALHALLDETEARLYFGRSTVQHWTELQSRHSHVSAIACKSVEKHVAEMTKLDQKQRRRRAIIAKRRVAEGPSQTASDVQVSGLKVPTSVSSTPNRRAAE